MFPRFRAALSALWLGLATASHAHVIPALDVITDATSTGLEVRMNCDIRLPLYDVPTDHPVVRGEWLRSLTPEKKADFLQKADIFLRGAFSVLINDAPVTMPEFQFDFSGESWNPDLPAEQDEVHLIAKTTIPLPSEASVYTVKASRALLWIRSVNGERDRRSAQPLFSGESGKPQALGAAPVAPPAAFSDFSGFVKSGWMHIVGVEVNPRAPWWSRVTFPGLDHILFVVGLFLLSRKWRPLLWQVTAFTIAHSITLALGMMGWVRLPSQIVESLIAGSIAFVALENLFSITLHWWRVGLVFLFGLMHGMGFASGLLETNLPDSQFLPALLGFNVGVECGQLTVLVVCFALFGWLSERIFRRFVSIPLSVVIASVALFWMAQRITRKDQAFRLQQPGPCTTLPVFAYVCHQDSSRPAR